MIFLFAMFAAVLLASALLVILHRNPVASALFLVLAFCSLAGLYVMLNAEFVGMVQVIVYAGAIMVLFLFVIMYLNLGRDLESGLPTQLRRGLGWVMGAVLFGEVVALVARRTGHWAGPVPGPVSNAPEMTLGNTQAIGQALYTRYLFPFEITSMLLLVAMIGVIVIGKGRATPPTPAAVEAPVPAQPRGGTR